MARYAFYNLIETIMHRTTYKLLCFLLLLAIIGCGEVEIPVEKEAPAEQPETPVEQPEAPGEQPETPPDTPETPGEQPETPGEESGEVQEDDGLTIGTANLTADGHLLIAGSLYLSLEERRCVGKEAADIAKTYQEGDLTDWHVPSKAEAQFLRDALACSSPYYYDEGNETLPPLNRKLEELSYIGIYSERYLCEDGTLTFDFKLGTNISSASKTQTYRLRLVRSK